MTKEELLNALKKCAAESPSEESHQEADGLLLRYINDPEILAAFIAIAKWYA